MANTILEKLQEKYHNNVGISRAALNDARNIAEAVAAINGTGARGANAIADKFLVITEDEEEKPDVH